MSTAQKFKDYAADCVRKAGEASTPADKNLMLNMGLAWMRLAQQVETIGTVAEDASKQAVPAEAT